MKGQEEPPRDAACYVDGLAAGGKYHFTTAEAVRALGASLPAVRASLRRLKRRGLVADPYRGFHVIVPPEYRRLGCLPAEQFIAQLMRHLDEPYYTALLSAAELHGAAHQRPQAFQVMVAKNRRPIECGAVRVELIARQAMASSAVIEKKTPRGMLRVSSPEVTALELVGYADHAGGIDNVATVLGELAEALDPQKLVDAAMQCPAVWSQRLGYLLDLVGASKTADALVPLVSERATIVAPLVRARSRAGAKRVDRWKLAVNSSVEPDA